MRIGLLLDPYGEGKPGGLGRFIYEFARALVAEAKEDSFVVYVKEEPATAPAFKGAPWSLVPLKSSRVWLTGGRRMDPKLDCQVFFTPIVPLFYRPKRSVVFALDFAYLDLPGKDLNDRIGAFFLKRLHARSFRLADRIVAISEETKRSAVRHFGIAPERITVIHLGPVVSDTIPEPVDVPAKFFLFAGVLKERKNVANIIRAFAFLAKNHPEYELLIAGKAEGAYYDELVRLTAELGVADCVRFLGYVTDAELAYLYRRATAFVFPSLIEGFGMPVLEAMHIGAPVVTSSTGAVAEVAGDAALLVDPMDPARIADGMERVAGDEALRAELIRKGHDRVKAFSWEKAARELRALMQETPNGAR